MTTESLPPPDGEPSLPDDVWDRFLEDSEGQIRATAPKEPSARARIVTRRLREEQERAAVAEAKRRLGRRGRANAPDTAWRSGRTDAAERRGRRRNRLRALVGVVLVVALVLLALSPGHAWALMTGHG